MKKKLFLVLSCTGMITLTIKPIDPHPLYPLMQYGEVESIPKIKQLVQNNPKTLEQAVTMEHREQGNYPIFFISQTSKKFVEELFKEVPEFKKYVNQKNKRGLTPLVMILHSTDMIDFLIKQGADINIIQEGDGKYFKNVTLLHLLIDSLYNELWRVDDNEDEEAEITRQKKQWYKNYLPQIELLLKNKADIHKKAEMIEIYSLKDNEYNKLYDISAYEFAKQFKLDPVVDLMKKYDTGIAQKELESSLTKLGNALETLAIKKQA